MHLRTLPAVSRSLIVSAREPSLSVKSVATRNRPSSSSGSSPSNVLFVKLLRISRCVVVLPSSSLLLLMMCPCADRSPLPILCRHGPSGGRRGLPRLPLRRYQSCRHPRQACHHVRLVCPCSSLVHTCGLVNQRISHSHAVSVANALNHHFSCHLFSFCISWWTLMYYYPMNL